MQRDRCVWLEPSQRRQNWGDIGGSVIRGPMRTLSRGRGWLARVPPSARCWHILITVSVCGWGAAGTWTSRCSRHSVSPSPGRHPVFLPPASPPSPNATEVPKPGDVLGWWQKQPWSSPGHFIPRSPQVPSQSHLYPWASIFPSAEWVSCSCFL